MKLSPGDLEMLARSWITPEIAEANGLFRVSSAEGAELIGRNRNGDYAGIAIPYFLPGADTVREYQLRMEETKLIRFAQLKEYVPRGRTTIWSWVKQGYFPSPVRIGKNGIAWRLEEVQAWIKSREKTQQV